jgi:hypothetical protein
MTLGQPHIHSIVILNEKTQSPFIYVYLHFKVVYICSQCFCGLWIEKKNSNENLKNL